MHVALAVIFVWKYLILSSSCTAFIESAQLSGTWLFRLLLTFFFHTGKF